MGIVNTAVTDQMVFDFQAREKAINLAMAYEDIRVKHGGCVPSDVKYIIQNAVDIEQFLTKATRKLDV